MIKIKNKKLLLTICSVVIVGTGAIGVTLSSFTSKDEVVNNFEVGNIDIENKEEKKDGTEGFDPTPDENGIITKKVSIKNTSTKNPAFVRVNITPRWVEYLDHDNNANTEKIEKPWSGTVHEKVVKLNFTNAKVANSATYPGPNKWMYGNDGYYYYTSILPIDNTETQDIDEGITSQILQSVQIDLNATKDGKKLVENPEDYEGKTLIVDVNSDAIQPTQQAYMDAWNIKDANIITLLNRLLGVNNGN